MNYYREDASRTDYYSPDRKINNADQLEYDWVKYIENERNESDLIIGLGLLGGSAVAAYFDPGVAVTMIAGEGIHFFSSKRRDSKETNMLASIKVKPFSLSKTEFEFQSFKLSGYTDLGQKLWYLTSYEKVVWCKLLVDGEIYKITEEMHDILLKNSVGGDTIVTE